MNEQLQEALSQLIEKSMAGVENSLDFLSAEIPDVIYQLLMWYGVESALYAILGVVLLIVYIPINKRLFIIVTGLPDYTDEKSLASAGLVIGNMIYLSVIALSINLTWLQIWIAPKVWLLDYASSIVK